MLASENATSPRMFCRCENEPNPWQYSKEVLVWQTTRHPLRGMVSRVIAPKVTYWRCKYRDVTFSVKVSQE